MKRIALATASLGVATSVWIGGPTGCGGELAHPADEMSNAPPRAPVVELQPAPPARAPAVADPLSIRVMTTELAKLRAERFVRCSFDGAFIAQAGYDGVDGLAATMEANYQQRLALPGAAVTQAQIDVCVDFLKTEGCVVGLAASIACNFLGTRAPGAGCLDGVQCVSGRCTASSTPVGDLGTSCGVCGERVELGEICNDQAVWCRAGLTCSEGRCVAPARVGATCASAPCETGLVCNADKLCATRLAAVQPGGACGQGTLCADNLRCKDGTCIAPPPLKIVTTGESCKDEPGMRITCHSSSCNQKTLRCEPRTPRKDEQLPRCD